MIKRTVYGIVALFMMLFAATSYAQLFRTYLSVNGSDANACTLVSPCRLLPAALNAVASGGEIWILDSGNFNTASVNIAKSVSILAIPGQVGSFVAINSTPALAITTAGVNVKFRNVVISNFAGSPGTDGIYMNNGAALTVEDSLFTDLPGTAIDVVTPAVVRVANTTVRDSGSGVYLLGATGNISNSRFYNSGIAVAAVASAGQSATATVSDTTAVDGLYGFYAWSTAASGFAHLTAIRCTAVNNGTGFNADATGGGANVSIMTVSYSMATGNIIGFAQRNVSTFRSLGNNDVHTNSSGDTLGVISVVSGT